MMVSFYNALLRMMGLSDDESPSTVSLRQAMSLPPVWYAHNKLCGDIGMLPIDVKRKVGGGSEPDLKHDGYRLLREQPNKIQAPSVFKEQIASQAIMYGNGRAAIIRNGDSIEELIPMLPDRTATFIYEGEKYHITKPLKDDNKNLFDGYRGGSEEYLTFSDADVLHITGFTYNGVEGIGLMQIAQAVFSGGVDAQRHVANQLRRGFRGKIFLEAPQGAFRNEGQAREFIETFNKAESGPDNAGRAGLLREGIKANAVNMSNNDAQFVQLQKFTRQDVGLLFGIESMPGDGESVSYNSLEQKNLAYLVALDRWLVKFEEQCDMKLRTERQRRTGTHYFKVNRAAILRTDAKTTQDVLCNYITHRVLNPNEAREKLDINPYKGGDEYVNPAITPGNGTEEENDQPESNEMALANARALEESVRSLIRTEANIAINGSNSRNFLDWIDANYAKWESKLAEKFEIFGLDRDLARLHCEESKAQLLQVASDSTQETLKNNVELCVKDWESRVYSILEGIKQ
jgi:HK97 family phage portal protein